VEPAIPLPPLEELEQLGRRDHRDATVRQPGDEIGIVEQILSPVTMASAAPATAAPSQMWPSVPPVAGRTTLA